MTREQKQHILHFAVSSLGGFMGGYAIYNHCDVFGNAQTANMIHLVSKIFTGDFEGVVFIVIALLTYILGNVFFVIADRFIKLETKTVSLIASTGCTSDYRNFSEYFKQLPCNSADSVRNSCFVEFIQNSRKLCYISDFLDKQPSCCNGFNIHGYY